ncbi:MAG: VWA domain-containing protein [Arcobacteraceae bacterium]
MQFLYPNVVFLMMIPLVVLFILILTSKSTVQKYFSKDILDKLRVGNSFLGKNTRNIFYFIVLFLFIIALARPVMNKKEQDIQQTLIPMVIALDVSNSMLVEDIYPNRISLAKKKLQAIIEKATNTTIGVVLFAKDSFILSPVTEDFVSLKYIINNLDTNLDLINGSNIFSTLEATRYMLDDFKVKNLIILSDGGNTDEYEDELDFVKENNIAIYSIGIATKEGGPIPEKHGYVTNTNGDIVTVQLNNSLKNLSMKSGGGYIDYTLDDTDVDAILNRINIQSKKEELNIQKVTIYTELFYYPLALGLFFLLIALSSLPTKKKKSILSLLFLAVSFSFVPTNSYAYTFNFEHIDKANELYEKKEYGKASDNYRKVNSNNQSLYNLANSLYKEEKYQEAIDLYSQIVTTDEKLEAQKLHNLGNSYVKINELEKAKEMYEKSLKLSHDKETQENLERVKKALEEKKQKQEKDNKENQDKEKDNKENKENQKKNEKQDKNQENHDDKKSKSENEDDHSSKEKKDKEAQEENKKQNKNKDKQKKNEENKQKQEKKSKETKGAPKQEKQNSQSENQMQNKKNELSDREEKKWMELLQNQQTPIYLQKVQTNKESKYDETQPW